MLEEVTRQVSEWYSPSGVRSGENVIGGLWPGPEILAINLIAENQPFDSTWHEKFRCNRHGRLMAASCQIALQLARRKAAVQAPTGFKISMARRTAGHGRFLPDGE
jgi:hypothetical protein